MALPTALFAMIASLALASAAVLSSVNAQQGTKRDHDSKEAIAAADAGASMALWRLNRFAGALSATTPCIGLSGNTLVTTTTAVDGWCPAISDAVGSATYSYRVTPFGGSTMRVIATGTDGVVSRRVAVSFKTTTVSGIFTYEGLVGQDSFTLSGNANIRVGIGTNGDLTSSGNAAICGDIRHGVGKKWNKSGNTKQCSGYSVTEGNTTLPSVETFIPSDIATNNSNHRITKCVSTENPPECQKDTYSGQWTSTSPLNPTPRTISLAGSETLTLGGRDYWLCKLSLSGNAELIMAAGTQVRLFFDTPEHCNGTTSQISFSGNSKVVSTGYQPKLGQFNVPGFYLLGSPSVKTSISLSGNAGTNEFVIYAPNTDISLSGNANYTGAIAGKTLTLSGNGEIKQDTGFKPPQVGGATLYERESYVECTGGTASPPDAYC